ncbi:MAG: ABC transporter permease [Ottowia sp.]|uniref:ABC transporter permease n=1 Tax=Ottowia sp. TaxID=1898956 RepID=UPI003C77EF91
MKAQSRMPKWAQAAFPVLTLLALVVIWECAVKGLKVPQWMLPAPTDIAHVSIDWGKDLMRHGWVTFYETVIGFGLALVIALPVAVLIAYTPLFRHTIYPALLALQSVPKVALAPLITLWLGFGVFPKVVVVFLVCFFPIVVSAITGLESTTRSRVDLMRSMQATSWQIFVRLRIPEAMPHILVGCKIGITFAVIGAVIGEFVGAEEGLGYLIMTSTAQSRTPLAFASLILLTGISIGLFYLIEGIEKLLIRWEAH